MRIRRNHRSPMNPAPSQRFSQQSCSPGEPQSRLRGGNHRHPPSRDRAIVRRNDNRAGPAVHSLVRRGLILAKHKIQFFRLGHIGHTSQQSCRLALKQLPAKPLDQLRNSHRNPPSPWQQITCTQPSSLPFPQTVLRLRNDRIPPKLPWCMQSSRAKNRLDHPPPAESSTADESTTTAADTAAP